MIDLIYFMFYCSAGDDGTKSKHQMVAYGMEIVATQLLSFFTFIIIGVFNINILSYFLMVLIIIPNAIVAYFLVNSYYIKSGRYHTILEKYETTPKRTRTVYKLIVIILFIISFILLFVGGIVMSYLMSLHE